MVMKKLSATLIAITLLALYTFPTIAQEGEGSGNEQGEMVVKTFTLTIYGEAPEGDSFFLYYNPPGFRRPLVEIIVFCGEPDSVYYPDIEPCQGGGSVYTERLELERGDELRFVLFHAGDVDAEDRQEILRDTETITSDVTNRAYYDFDTDQGGAGDGSQAPDLPDTGAGGMAGGGLPVANGVGGLALLIVGAYAWRRRLGW